MRTQLKRILPLGMYFVPHYGYQRMPEFPSFLFISAVNFYFPNEMSLMSKNFRRDFGGSETGYPNVPIFSTESPGNPSVLGFLSVQLAILKRLMEASWQIH